MAGAFNPEIRQRNARLKAQWLQQILLDTGLSHRSHRVGAYLAWCFDKNTGCTIVGRQRAAERLGVTDRTIDSAIADLEARGHVKVQRSRGRGLANTYFLVLKK